MMAAFYVNREELFISVAALTNILPVWVAKYAVKAAVLFKTILNQEWDWRSVDLSKLVFEVV